MSEDELPVDFDICNIVEVDIDERGDYLETLLASAPNAIDSFVEDLLLELQDIAPGSSGK